MYLAYYHILRGWYSPDTLEELNKYLLNEYMNKYGRTPNSSSAPDSNFFLRSMRNPLYSRNNKFSISTRSSFFFFFLKPKRQKKEIQFTSIQLLRSNSAKKKINVITFTNPFQFQVHRTGNLLLYDFTDQHQTFPNLA